jgi:tRNA(fMet)-specific endonuclease VapC
MSALYLLDTNIVSYVLKGIHPGLRGRVDSKNPTSLAISAVTAAELRFWLARRQGLSRISFHIEDFLRRVPTLPWDASAATAYGALKATLFSAGRPLAELDLQIASHALALDAILVTHDAAFAHVPNLRTEDWVNPLP